MTSRGKEMLVWLVRHAETATPHLIHGCESDVGLGAHGQLQVEAVAPWFQKLSPDVVVSSAMSRAIATAEPIARLCQVPHEIEPELHERKLGPYSLKGGAEVDALWAETVRHWEAGETSYAVPGMESFDHIAGRVVPAFNRVVERHPNRRVLIVAHGVVCKVLLLSLLVGHGPADWTRLGRALNVSVSELVPEGDRWRAHQLLIVPPPVQAVNESRLESGKRSEA